MSEEFRNIKFDSRINKDQIKYTKADYGYPHTKASISVYDKSGNCRGSVSDPYEEVEFKVIDGEIFKIDGGNQSLVKEDEKECATTLRLHEQFKRKMAHDFVVGESKHKPYGIL